MTDEPSFQRPPLARWMLAGVGVLSVALGFVGMFVPVLPTTPFLLLAAACFVRSSDRLYRWLMGHRLFGPYIRNYRTHRAITLRAKLVTLSLLWLSIGYAVVAVAQSWVLKAVLLTIACAVTIHVARLRTI